MVPISPLLLASLPWEEALGETFLAVPETICFRDPPRVPPARRWLSTYAFRKWNGKMDPDKLMNSKTNDSSIPANTNPPPVSENDHKSVLDSCGQNEGP
ncbi:hypothetical protein E5288_WYG016442 [Bos mutus]|uniref:Uncharacterized protein n=1 Tax=Bos mutus TaxID=72004 RepID=A0A6B0R6H5_9CETA|nr:hypothetical protein [Bos mutus]